MKIPKPLFDTLSHLEPVPIGCIQNYLNQLGLDQITKEYQLACLFLQSYAGSPDTFTAYRREVEKLLQWVWIKENILAKDIGRDAIQRYIKFVHNPPTHWIGLKTVKRFIENADGERVFNPAWRPFVVKQNKSKIKMGNTLNRDDFVLSHKSIESMIAVLSSFFTFLIQERYTDINPMMLIRQKNQLVRREQQRKVTRKLSDIQWSYVIEAAESISKENPQEYRIYFIMSCFFLLGLRISELAETPGRIPIMGDFAPDKNGLWWFTTVGKGNKIRDVAVPDVLLEILKEYRTSRNLSPLPIRGESSPLVHSLRGKRGLGTRQIRNLVQTCFDKAIERLKHIEQDDEAHDLEAATVHWLRHTSISSDVMHRPREHVRDDVGHENASITDKYIDIDRIARHESAQRKSLKPKDKLKYPHSST